MNINKNNFFSRFMNRIGEKANNTNTENDKNINKNNQNDSLIKVITSDEDPKLRMTGIVVAPTEEPEEPENPRMTGIVVAPTEEPKVPIEDIPTTGIVVAPTEEPEIPTSNKKPDNKRGSSYTPTVKGTQKVSIFNRIFGRMNNFFNSIFKRFW